MNYRTLLVLPVLALTACGYASQFETASTLGAGRYALMVEPSLSTAGFGVSPDADVGFTAGLGDRVDVGARLGFFGASGHLKLQLTDPASRGLKVSVMPTVGWAHLPSAAVGSLSLLLGVPFGPHELVFGGKMLAMGSGELQYGWGGSVGAAFEIGPLRVLPEASVLVATPGPYLLPTEFGGADHIPVVVQLGTSFQWIGGGQSN